MKPIVIWTPPYDPLSGGIIVLHRLCQELRELGQDAYINVAGCGLNTPTWHGESNDFTAIYPEIVFGNPLNAPKVVRWVLNKPGKIGGPLKYPGEIVFSFSRNYLEVPENRYLSYPTLETDIFIDKHLERTYPLVYVGKGYNIPRVPETSGIREITRVNCLNKPELAEIFNHATVLYSYDVITAITDMARLCGCPVCLIPDSDYPKENYKPELGMNGIGWYGDKISIDSDKFRKTYLNLFKKFKKQLLNLIKAINE